jgi:hypothetical protein
MKRLVLLIISVFLAFFLVSSPSSVSSYACTYSECRDYHNNPYCEGNYGVGVGTTCCLDQCCGSGYYDCWNDTLNTTMCCPIGLEQGSTISEEDSGEDSPPPIPLEDMFRPPEETLHIISLVNEGEIVLLSTEVFSVISSMIYIPAQEIDGGLYSLSLCSRGDFIIIAGEHEGSFNWTDWSKLTRIRDAGVSVKKFFSSAGY